MKNTTLKKRLFRSILILFAFVFSFTPVFALDQETLKFYAKNNILYYDPSGTSCLPGSSASPVEGNSQIEIAWNYFVNSGIAGVYDNAAVIAGIVGNLIGESGVDPFLDGSYCGVFQASSGSFAEIRTDVNNQVPGASSMWRKSSVGKEYSSSELELAKQAIVIELDYLTGNNGKNSSAYTPNFNNFVKTIPDVSNPSPESYAELFLIWVERAVADDSCIGGTSSIDPSRLDDPGVQNVANNKIYPKNPSCQNIPYQGTYKRRGFAADVYNKYASNTVNSLGGSSDGSTVTVIGDSITYGSRNEILNKFSSADITSEIGRPFGTGVSIAQDPLNAASYHFNDASWAADDGMLNSELKKNVVIALGSNNKDGLTATDIQSMINAVGKDKNIYFVTNYMSPSTTTYASEYNDYKNGYETNNNAFREAAANNPNIYLIDWAGAVQEGSYLASDGLHPNADGQKLFAELIYKAINKSTATSICDPSGSSGAATGGPWDGSSIPWWSQVDGYYGDKYFGDEGFPATSGNKASVKNSACAVFSMASIITMLSGTTVEPKTLLDWVGKEGTYGKHNDYYEGMTNITNTFNKTYSKHFPGLTYTSIKTLTGTQGGLFSAFKTRVETALNNGNYIIIAGKTSNKAVSPYTSGGHFITIRGIANDGNWLIINSGSDGHEDTFSKTFDPHLLWQEAYTAGIISL